MRPVHACAWCIALAALSSQALLAASAQKRAAAAQACGKTLEQAWRAGLGRAPATGGLVRTMMYSFSPSASKRAGKRIAAHPEMLGNLFAMRTGAGGTMMDASKPADAWRNPPSEWFATLCDIAVEAESNFIELAFYASADGSGLVFTARAATGTGGKEGFWIGQGNPMAPPAGSN